MHRGCPLRDKKAVYEVSYGQNHPNHEHSLSKMLSPSAEASVPFVGI